MAKDLVDEFYNVLDERAGRASTPEGFGQLIGDRLSELGLSQRQLSDALSIGRRSLQRILNGEAEKVDVRTFVKLRFFLATSFDDLAELFISGLDSEELRELHRAKKAGYIARTFDLEGLKRAGFLDSTTDFQAIEERIQKFFGYDSVLEYDSDEHGSLFSRTQRAYSGQMLRFWVKSARHQIEHLGNPHEFDRDMLVKAIPGLRILTRDEKYGLLRAARALYSIGVTVVVQRYLTGTQIRGATFVVNDKPAIVLTDFNKRYDTLWFALLHELYHVLKDLRIIKEWGVHLTGENNLAVNEMSEDNADDFARELLLSEDKRKYIAQFIDVPGVVEENASKWNVHPSIIYGTYMWEHGDYEKYRKYVPEPDGALEQLRVHPWEEESLEQAVDSLQSVYSTN